MKLHLITRLTHMNTHQRSRAKKLMNELYPTLMFSRKEAYDIGINKFYMIFQDQYVLKSETDTILMLIKTYLPLMSKRKLQ